MPNEVRPSREGMLAAMAAEHERLLDMLRRVEAAGRLHEPNAYGQWSARDVYAHVVFYQRWISVQVGAALDLRLPEGPPGEVADLDRRNALIHDMMRDVPMDDLRRDDAEAYAAVRERVAAMTEADLDRLWEIHGRGARPQPEGSTVQGFPLWQWLNGDTCGHYEEHARGLEAWLATEASC